MAIVARIDFELHQLNGKTSSLNSELKKNIYMSPPNGFLVKEHEYKIYKWKKSLYGLKQWSRQWFLKFHQTILDLGYQVNPLDDCVYS